MNLADIWAGSVDPNPQQGNTEIRAMDTARTIMQRPSEIVISRRNPATGQTIYLDPITVRVEIIQNIRGANELRDNWTDISRQYVVLIALPGTDLLRADQFFYGGLMYEIIEFVNTVPGRLLCSCEATP